MSLKKNKAAKDAFDKAKGAVVYPKAKTEYFILNVYEDLNGKAEITGTHDLLARGWKYNQGKTKNAGVNATLKKAKLVKIQDVSLDVPDKKN